MAVISAIHCASNKSVMLGQLNHCSYFKTNKHKKKSKKSPQAEKEFSEDETERS